MHIAAEKAAQRTALLKASSNASADYQQLITELTQAHRVAFDRIDWKAAAGAVDQPNAVRLIICEKNARDALAAYSPNWFARTFGFARRKRARLEASVEAGIQADTEAFASRDAEVHSRNAATAFARRLMALDHSTMIAALQDTALSRLPFCLEQVRIVIQKPDRVVAIVDGLNIDVMPTQSVTLLASGKTSIKALPQSRVRELHRDNICSAAVRVALELLRALPVSAVEVLMQTDLLDRASGLIYPAPVLHLRITAQALTTVHLDRADPYPLVERLGGLLNWRARTGFEALDTAALNLPFEKTEEV